MKKPDPTQLGFERLILDAEVSNSQRLLARQAAHLPDNMDAAFPHYRSLIVKHHAAMLAADWKAVIALREEAYLLAEKLNGFMPGICADEAAPGNVLERQTGAPEGNVPLWGQRGSFEIGVASMRARIEIDGLFGIGTTFMTWPGFSAHAIEWDKAFLSETGYRSFIGLQGELTEGMTPDAFAFSVIERHVSHALKGRLLAIKPEYRERAEKRP